MCDSNFVSPYSILKPSQVIYEGENSKIPLSGTTITAVNFLDSQHGNEPAEDCISV
jgi:hypothetical protein